MTFEVIAFTDVTVLMLYLTSYIHSVLVASFQPNPMACFLHDLLYQSPGEEEIFSGDLGQSSAGTGNEPTLTGNYSGNLLG